MIGILTTSTNAVMATGAGPDCLEVIESNARPGIGTMAILAQVARWQMVDWLTHSDAAVVAADTIGGDACVIKANGW
jgi:hypothetical protein